jgi:hypothetical protein
MPYPGAARLCKIKGLICRLSLRAARLSGVPRGEQDEHGGTPVKEILRTNDVVLVSAVEALLNGAGIPHIILDRNMSVLEGSLNILPRRILVDDDYSRSARRLLEDAGLARELRPDVG